MRHFALRLASGIAILAAARADIVNVAASDSRVSYSGSGWASAPYTLTSTDPPAPASGPNSTVCALQAPGETTTHVNDAFTLLFNGVSVRLVTVSRSKGGVFAVTLDGITSKVDGFSTGANCGVSFDSGPLRLGGHSISVALVANDPLGDADDATPALQLLGLIFDSGINSTSTSSSAGGFTSGTSPSTPASGATGTGAGSTAGGSGTNVGAIAGGVVGGVAAGIIVALLVFFFLLRGRRRGPRAGAPEHQELLASPWHAPGAAAQAPPPQQSTIHPYYNNATSYYPSEPSRSASTREPVRSDDTAHHPQLQTRRSDSTGLAYAAPSVSSRGGALDDADVERIAGRLATLIGPAAPQPAPQPTRSKENYLVRAQVSRTQTPQPPHAPHPGYDVEEPPPY